MKTIHTPFGSLHLDFVTMLKKLFLFSVLISFLFTPIRADKPADDEPMREYRAVWLTSVWNIDWPHSTAVSAASQMNRLREMLDVLHETNINAVLFQVRPNADALYQSAYEPWSQWITGTRGQEPEYDPLALVIKEANKRGMEVHAWLNPYRFENTAGQYAGLPGDYSQTHPELIFTHGNRTYFDPGQPGTTQLIKEIIADLIENYELDGVVFDDYFYPSGMTLGVDQHTYDSYTTEELEELILPYYPTINRGNFRRASVNRMIKEVHDTIKVIDPNMIFGVSPAGIYSTQASAAANWGTTLPPGITGADNFNTIFCDPLAWLHDGSVDYLSPQLYWKIGGPQDYLTLVEWWGQECERKGRHAYPSIGTYRLPSGKEETPADKSTWDNIFSYFKRLRDILFPRKDDTVPVRYSLQEIENQILANRNNEHNNVFGSIFFSTRDLTSRVPDLAPFLAEGVFADKAIAPFIDWFTPTQPSGPIITEIASVGEDADLASISISNSQATRFLLYGWEEMPTAKNKQNPDFLQVVFGKELALFFHDDNSYFAVADFLPNKEIGFLSTPVAWQYITPVDIISPDGETVCDMFEFSWTDHEGSEAFQLLIANRRTPNELEFTSPLLSENTFELPSGVLHGQEHYIARIKSFADDMVSYSAPAHFFTGYPLETVLNAPADGASNVNMQTTFQWNPVTDASHYHLQVATDDSFDEESIIIDEEPIATNFFVGTLQQPNTLHVARVRAVNECGYAYWSNMNSFTTTTETSVAGMVSNTLTAYPNPAVDHCYVEYPRSLGERVISIYNHKGQLMRTINKSDESSSDRIDLEWLPAGLYVINIHTAKQEQFSVKVVKSN